MIRNISNFSQLPVPKDLVTALFEKWEGGDFMEQLSEIASLVSVGVPLTP
jgi:hypothetical protein